MTTPAERPRAFAVGDWLADPTCDALTRGDERVKIEPKAMEVLVLLARHQGEVVAQNELEAQVWRGLIVTSQSVYQSIAQLRRVLGDNPREPRYIETVPRRGYRLIMPVRWQEQRSSEIAAMQEAAPGVGAPEPSAALVLAASCHVPAASPR